MEDSDDRLFPLQGEQRATAAAANGRQARGEAMKDFLNLTGV
jgi:hypothetical protein